MILWRLKLFNRPECDPIISGDYSKRKKKNTARIKSSYIPYVTSVTTLVPGCIAGSAMLHPGYRSALGQGPEIATFRRSFTQSEAAERLIMTINPYAVSSLPETDACCELVICSSMMPQVPTPASILIGDFGVRIAPYSAHHGPRLDSCAERFKPVECSPFSVIPPKHPRHKYPQTASTMPRVIKWGAGLSIVLRSLPALVLPPAAVSLTPALLARVVSPDSLPEPLRTFLTLPAAVQAIVLWVAYVTSRRTIRGYQRRLDRKRLGPDVVEVPRVKLNWPWNLDLIPFVIHSRETDYCAAPWTRFIREYGYTFNLRLFGEDLIMTFEPENIKAILSTDFNSYEKGPLFREKMDSVLGTGIFNADGDMWKFHRGMSRPYFTRDRISHFDNFARHSDLAISKLLSRLNESAQPGFPVAVDFQDLVARFTLDSGTEFLFGQDVCSLAASLPYPHDKPSKDRNASFSAAFARVQQSLIYRLALGYLWPWMELFWNRTDQDMEVIDAYVMPILKTKLEEKRARGLSVKPQAAEDIGANGSEDADDTLLDHLVKFTDDISVIKDELINILVAARDTTAATLTFTVYILAENPNIMVKLREEILGRLGTSNHPTSEDFKEMKYLRAVLNETLRLFPAVPVNERAAVRSTVLHSAGKKYYVPAGASMPYSVLHMHRRKDLWGPDAEEYDPERWLDERLKKYVTPNPFIFLPFNAGPRICVGQQFAYNEASYFLCRLLQRVELIELVPKAYQEGTLPPPEWKHGEGRKVYEKIWPKSDLTIFCNGGLWVRMKEASPVAE